jgi:long-chain fatty acid transport protein
MKKETSIVIIIIIYLSNISLAKEKPLYYFSNKNIVKDTLIEKKQYKLDLFPEKTERNFEEENIDVMVFNPAYLAFVSPDLGAEVVGSYVAFASTFKSDASGDLHRVNGSGFVPAAYGSWRVVKPVVLGVSLNASGGSVDWGNEWEYGHLVEKAIQSSIFISPTISIKLAKWLSIGGSYSIIRGNSINRINVDEAIADFIPDIESLHPSIDFAVDLDQLTTGNESVEGNGKTEGSRWSIGFVLKPTPKTNFLTIGLSYTPKTIAKIFGDAIWHNIGGEGKTLTITEGAIDTERDLAQLAQEIEDILGPGIFANPLSGDSFRNSQFIGGSINGQVKMIFNRKFSLDTKVVVKLNNELNNTNFILYKNDATRLIQRFNLENLETRKPISYTATMVGKYLLSDVVQLDGLLQYDESITPTTAFAPSTPIPDKYVFGLGISVKKERFLFTGTANYVYMPNTKSNNTETGYIGDIKTSAFQLNLGVNYNINFRGIKR